MTTKTLRIVTAAVLAAVLLVAPVARATGPARAPIRIMTYNTALMNLKVVLKNVFASFPISWDVNEDGYGGAPYDDRVAMIADSIKQEDPDVVVLNEVWNDDQKKEFVKQMVPLGYTSYIKKISGKEPGILGNPFAEPGITTANIIELAATVLHTAAGQSVFDFVANLFCPIIPLPGFCPITGAEIKLQDSGLMLFSKHPFVKFDGPTFPAHPGVIIDGANGNQGWGPGTREVAVAVYQGARGMDQLASKAAGMVRIQLAAGSIADIVFSHSNADEKGPEENADVRAFQMFEVRKMIKRALSNDELAYEQVYMLGDLNTPGYNQETGKVEEWSTLFGKNAANSPWKINPGVFFACGDAPQCSFAIPGQPLNLNGSFFTDAWGWETSTADQSKTNYIDGQYYDYVLHNRPPRQCMQYIRIGSEMTDSLTGLQLSDHLPVHADFNLEAPRCTPNLDDPNGATVVDLTTDNHVKTFNQNSQARITHPGSMQWYYLPQPGTYWVNVIDNAAHVGFEVFAEDNLSDPLPPYHGETDPRKGLRFVTYKPIYVRTFAIDASGKPDRNWVGTYAIQLWRSTGATPDDSIGITPAEHWKYDWSSTTNQVTVWFDFYTNQTRAQEFANTTIIHEVDDAGLWQANAEWDMGNALWVQTGANPLLMSSYTQLDQQLKQANPTAPDFPDFVNPDPQANPAQQVTGFSVEMPDLPGEPNNAGGHDPKKYFYTVTRDDFWGTPPQFLHSHLLLLTDLQYLQPVAFQATDGQWLYKAKEFALLGFMFDGTSQDYCGGMGPFPSDCIGIPMNSPGFVPLPVNDPAMRGPFKTIGTPTAWIFDGWVPTQIGRDHDGGSDISDVNDFWIYRDQVGTPGCFATKNHLAKQACWDKPISSPNSPNEYSYHLWYGITHDLPYQKP